MNISENELFVITHYNQNDERKIIKVDEVLFTIKICEWDDMSAWC